MEVEVSKENICINKLIAEKKETCFIHNDIIVPDTKPDILNTINATGNICIYKKEVLDGKVKIDGNVNCYVMYLPDSKDDNLRALNCEIDFSESISMPDVKEGMSSCIKCSIKDIECKVLNGRKISVKAQVEFNIKVYSNEDVQIINTINNVDDIQTLHKSFDLDSCVGYGKTSVYAKDTLSFNNEDELAEILKVDLALADKDIKISYNKVLAKCDLEIKIMYLTEDNRVSFVNGKIPIVGFIDMPNVSEDNICDVNYELKNMIIRPNAPEEYSVYVEFEIEPSVTAYERKQINLIEDLYSPTANLEYSQKYISSLTDRQESTKDFVIKESVKIPNITEEGLINAQIMPVITNTQVTNTKILYSGEISINFIFMNDNTVNSKLAKIPFEISENNPSKTDKIDIETQIYISKADFNVRQKGEVEAEIEMKVTTKTSKNVSMNIIDNIEVSNEKIANEDYDSLILYIVKPGDTVWNIAKSFNSTVEEIARMNGLEDPNKIDVGQKIYIPKFQMVRKENDAREQAISV